MIEDRPEDVGPAPDPGRPKRPPPTIDLEATEVSGETQKAAGAAPSEPDPKAEAKAEAEPEPEPEPKPESKPPEPGRPPSAAVSPWAVAVVSGAVAASLVIAVGWMLGSGRTRRRAGAVGEAGRSGQ